MKSHVNRETTQAQGVPVASTNNHTEHQRRANKQSAPPAMMDELKTAIRNTEEPSQNDL
ncbi:hypothetical protein [Alicyclobacillus fastidiosus]|uniref:Uncharacterized protein n=1 Tax=Alicyclobacillus fastidiosus TaxID=392011 RepID=A0ABV5AJN3_9BACL|nr:hypothetical protein [Alicyclobacillus fastidiosus]WEH08023.1 hypothetical protein PYS47_14830 [Alicyclobacillus fastidiosus]